MLSNIITALRCPNCAEPVALRGSAVQCGRGHSFDVARQGYVNLLAGAAPAAVETAEMVAARAQLLSSGPYAHIIDAVAAASADLGSPAGGLVVDAGAGTGHYLAAALDRLPQHEGAALDLSRAAVRIAARAHPRAGAVVCDIWRGLPLVDGCVDVLLDVFAPRNAAEFRRVLRPDGALVVVTPGPDHLVELVRALNLLVVDPAKPERLDANLGTAFTLRSRHRVTRPVELDPDQAATVVAMGPSAWHTDSAGVRNALDALPTPIAVTTQIDLSIYHPAP